MTIPKHAAVFLIIFAAFSFMSYAQENTRAPFKKGGIEIGGDYFRPSSSSSGLFSASGAGYFAINFRPLRNLQIDTVQVNFIAARTDRETLIQFSDGSTAVREIKSHQESPISPHFRRTLRIASSARKS